MQNKTEVYVEKAHRWDISSVHGINVWTSGYFIDESHESIVGKIVYYDCNNMLGSNEFSDWLNHLRGHFAIICSSDTFIFSAVDKVSTIPIYYNYCESRFLLSDSALYLKKIAVDHQFEYDRQAVLELAMSGYTIGEKTIFKSVSQLTAGSFILYRNERLDVSRYFNYMPWNVRDRTENSFKIELSERTWSIVQSMVNSVHGRQIVVPLSAGNDSRLIISLLKELNVKDVCCISYGLPGNFEAETAKLIANKLGFKWIFVPLSLRKQRKSFSEEDFTRYLDFSETLSSHPVLIDYTVINYIKKNKLVSNDAVFVNGNSGDFISGAHINSYIKEGDEVGVDDFIRSYIEKHYSLWRCLKTDQNVSKITTRIGDYVMRCMNIYDLPKELLWAIGENFEWMGRQSKLVTGTQRSYEFHGYSWRLPLWDPLYLDFWEGIPSVYKYNQKIYKDMLLDNNWGGVWRDVGVNDFKIQSNRLRFVRGVAKIPFLFAKRAAWHRFDQKFFSYFIDNTAGTALVSYLEVLLDGCGARNRNSWIVKKYLSGHRVSIDKLK